jgi:hypothetical protein
VTVQVPHSDGPDQPLCEVPFGGDRNGRCTPLMLGRSWGCGPVPHTTTPVHRRGQPSLSPWKTQCAQSNQNWLNAPPWHVVVPTGCEPRKGLPARHLLCWPWRPSQATRCRPLDGPTPGRTVPAPWQTAAPPGAPAGPVRWRRPPDRASRGPQPVAALDVTKGTAQGARNCNARGEILRPLQDRQRRRRSARSRPSIKSESLGIEEDQTPS